MAEYRYESVSLGREHRWKLPNPVNYVEFQKALGAATTQFRRIYEVPPSWDNDICVKADEEHIVVFFVEDEEDE